MQLEHTADCFEGAWFKSPLSTEAWHLRHIWRETAFQFAEELALNGVADQLWFMTLIWEEEEVILSIDWNTQ